MLSFVEGAHDDGGQICMDHLLNVMRKPDERESGFVALSEMASAVGKELKQYLPDIMNILKDAVRILTCCHVLATLWFYLPGWGYMSNVYRIEIHS